MTKDLLVKKISINGRFLCRKPTGVDRFATELLRVIDGWVGSGAGEVLGLEFEVITPDRPAAHWCPSFIPVVKAAPFDGYIWEQTTLASRRKGRLLLSLCNTGPILAAGHLVAIHDATPFRVPESFSRGFRSAYGLLMPALGRAARVVVTVSRFSANEIHACYGIPQKKIYVVGNSGEHILRATSDQAIIRRLGIEGVPYVLAVATMAKHKNVQALLRISKQLEASGIRVVVVGGANQRVFSENGIDFGPEVVRAGYVSDGELRALYEAALCFVFPSIYEGFGIPPLEAMELGCPVVASNAAALPEILGEAALYAAPMQHDALFAQVAKLRGDASLRKRLAQAGLRRAAQYRWEASARELLALCRAELGGQASL